MDKCRNCNVEECIKNKCENDNPYMCINGPASGGCNSNAQFWPNKPNDCYDCCDTTNCQNINNSYHCHSTTRNCEGSPLPPDLSQNRFATKEECERVMKLCRRPSPRPIPPSPRPIPPGPRPVPPGPRPIPPISCRVCKEDADGIVIDDDPNTCVRNHPDFEIENCCCEAGQRCPNQDDRLACVPVWAKEQIAANSSCPDGYGWSRVGLHARGLPCVEVSPAFQ